MNKSELIEVVTQRLGDRKTASTAVEAVVDAITRAVAKGEKVGITGFGVFEKVDRAARTARNPATGAAVKLKKTSVPKFRPGQGFKDIVSGAKKVSAATSPRAVTARAGNAARSAAKAPAKSAAGTPAKAANKTPAKAANKTPTKASAAPAKKAPAKKAPATKSAAKAPAKSAGTKAPAAKASSSGSRSTAASGAKKKAPAKAAKKTPAKK